LVVVLDGSYDYYILYHLKENLNWVGWYMSITLTLGSFSRKILSLKPCEVQNELQDSLSHKGRPHLKKVNK
jgi:hypothetical protein